MRAAFCPMPLLMLYRRRVELQTIMLITGSDHITITTCGYVVAERPRPLQDSDGDRGPYG